MPDFDAFERLIRQSMVVEEEAIRDLVHQMAEIPGRNRPELFKPRSVADLEAWVCRARQALAERFGPNARFSTTDLNIEGADLQVIGDDREIELKTGKVTNANIGIGPMAWALGDDTECELHDIMVMSIYERRELADQRDWNGVRASQSRVMERLFAYFCERLQTDKDAPPRLAHYSRAIARGITKKRDIVCLFGRAEDEWQVPHILHARWQQGWVPRANPFLPDERIVVESVRNDGHGGKAGVPRAWVRVKGLSSGRTADFYPNYKNSFRGIAAKHWVQTACFHVWIDK